MSAQQHHSGFYDELFGPSEQLPRRFYVVFKEIGGDKSGEIRVVINDEYQLGDIVNDNSYESDYYRYHDVFHCTFATLLGWSPCARAMMKRKRKSVAAIDTIEDGARATITEEAISMIIFNEAKRKKFFEGKSSVSKTTLRIVQEMTETFEVKDKSGKEWESAILKSYEVFRALIKHGGGKITFDMLQKKVDFSLLN